MRCSDSGHHRCSGAITVLGGNTTVPVQRILAPAKDLETWFVRWSTVTVTTTVQGEPPSLQAVDGHTQKGFD
jgi:hypothetical protein